MLGGIEGLGVIGACFEPVVVAGRVADAVGGFDDAVLFRRIAADFMALTNEQVEMLRASDELREIERPRGEMEQI